MKKHSNISNHSAKNPHSSSLNSKPAKTKPPHPIQSKEKKPQKKIPPSLKELQTLKEEYSDLKKRFQYLQAEFANFKKQSAKAQLDIAQYANFTFIQELLTSVLNDFNRALGQSLSENNIEKFKQGMQIIHSQFIKHLKKYGVEEISPQGEIFDPHFHEVLSMEVKIDVPENTVLQVCKIGYKLNDRLIQPAQVIVSKKS